MKLLALPSDRYSFGHEYTFSEFYRGCFLSLIFFFLLFLFCFFFLYTFHFLYQASLLYSNLVLQCMLHAVEDYCLRNTFCLFTCRIDKITGWCLLVSSLLAYPLPDFCLFLFTCVHVAYEKHPLFDSYRACCIVAFA